MIAPALFVDSHLFYVVVCRLVSQGLSRGMSEATLHGFSGLAQISGPVFHQYDDGLRFAEIARRLGEAYRMPGTKGFFAMEVASIWTQPIAVAIDFIRRAQQSATDTGDVSYACYSSVRLVTDLLVQGRDLNEAALEAERGIALARKVKFRDSADMLVCQHRFIQSMRGETLAFGLFGDATFDEDAYERDLAGTRMSTLVAWYWILEPRRSTPPPRIPGSDISRKCTPLRRSARRSDPRTRVPRRDGGAPQGGPPSRQKQLAARQ